MAACRRDRRGGGRGSRRRIAAPIEARAGPRSGNGLLRPMPQRRLHPVERAIHEPAGVGDRGHQDDQGLRRADPRRRSAEDRRLPRRQLRALAGAMSSGSTRSSAHDEPPAQTGGRGEETEARARDPAREGSRRKQLEYWLGHFAQFDLLTDLPNRSQFIDRLDGAIARAVRSKALLGVMLLNLDQFKSVNTTHGLRFGDAVLKRMGERFRECTRTSDSIARLGGDEFSVILEGLESEDGATIAAERMQTALAKPLVIDDRELVVTTTAGIAFHPQHGATVDALLHHADLALSHAKERRRGAWALYSPELALVNRREEERR